MIKKRNFCKSVGMYVAIVMLSTLLLPGCGKKTAYVKNENLDTSKEINLVIAGNQADNKGLEYICQKFESIYPNCKVDYEFLQNYTETLPLRFVSESDKVDLFLTTNIQEGSDNLNYAVDLLEYPDKLNLDETFKGLVDNFIFYVSSEEQHLYAVPMGVEMRGIFVNTTLLDKLGIQLPKNKDDFLKACDVLVHAGYIPLQGDPGVFGQQLMFPAFVHTVVADGQNDELINMIKKCEDGTADLFKEQMEFLYDLTRENYYNYKSVTSETGRFLDPTDENNAKDFLNIDTETGTKKNDIGEVAFMPGPNTIGTIIEKTKNDYHSNIEYQFILAPVSDEGGYAHMSPTRGLAINKYSDKIDWALEFMNFFFKEENNKEYAKESKIGPNIKSAVEYISNEYHIPKNQITDPSDVTFDYNFFKVVLSSIVSVTKANNPKYMQDMGDETYQMYDLSYYMDMLKTAFSEQKSKLEEQN